MEQDLHDTTLEEVLKRELTLKEKVTSLQDEATY